MAANADPLVNLIEANKKTITEAKTDDMENTLVQVTGFLEEAKGDAAKLEVINGLQTQLDSRGVLYNRHTLVSALDAKVQSEQYGVFLTSKATAFKEEIDHKKLRGVTPQQYEEMKLQFDTSRWTSFSPFAKKLSSIVSSNQLSSR